MSVYLVGDSLSSPTHAPNAKNIMEDRGWTVNGIHGEALWESMHRIRVGVETGPDVMVIALGSNDVNQKRTDMRTNINRALSICRSVPYVFFTTVKVNEVSAIYGGGKWKENARKWNRLVFELSPGIMNWNLKCQGHPGWFIPDGLHMNNTGQTNYANFMINRVGARG